MPDPLNGPPPYTPRIPASSNCKTFQSTDLFLAATSSAAVSLPSTLITAETQVVQASGSAATPTGSAGSGAVTGGSGSGAASGSKSGSSAPAGATGGSSSAATMTQVPSGFFGLGFLALLGALVL